MIDNVAAAFDGVRHLLNLGRRRVAFLGLVDGDITMTNRRRLLGYQEALVGAGVRLDPELVLQARGFDSHDAEAAVESALDRGLDFDAILSRDDRFAAGALTALRRRGIAVPDDVAIVGWDDSAIAGYTTPTLTSVAPDKRALATRAFELLQERMTGITAPAATSSCRTALRARQRTRRLTPPADARQLTRGVIGDVADVATLQRCKDAS